MIQMTIDDAIAQRDAGMHRVAANNEALNEGWQNLADAFMRRYAMTHKTFFPWEWVDAFIAAGYVEPHDWRAVGAVYRRAVEAGLITQGHDTAKHPRRHATITRNWVSLVYKEAA